MFGLVSLNDVDTGLIVEFTCDDDDLAASGDDLVTIGVDVAPGTALVRLRAIAGLDYAIDRTTQTVRLRVAPESMTSAKILAPVAQTTETISAWGGLLNYSLYGDDRGAGGATGELRLFGPVGVVSSGFLVQRDPGHGSIRVARLDTRYVVEDLSSARRLIVGDFVGADGSANGAIRAIGIQVATDFTLRPDMVTAPMPNLSGGNGVPSTVDVFVNGVRRLTQDVGAGRFAVSSVPMVDGAGQISLLVRDILGRESVQQLSFYSSRELLRPGLTRSSLQVGLRRANAYAPGDQYGAGFVSGTLRHGLGEWMTGETRLALAGSVQVAGAAMTVKLGEFGIGSINADLSHSSQGDGGQVGVALRRDARRASFFLSAEQRFGRFKTLASDSTSQHIWRFQAGGTWQSLALGGVSLSATGLRAGGVTTRILAASWSRPLGERSSLFANIVESRSQRSGLLATVGLTIVLSPRSNANAQLSHGAGGATGSANWSRYGDADRGIDWRAGISRAPGRSFLSGGAALRGDSGQIGADIEVGERRTAIRAFASGAAIWLGGRPALTGAVGQSFALVKTGLADVAVRLENRPAGLTRRDGSLFLPNLPANTSARIGLDYDGIDLDHDVVQAELTVQPRGAGGTIIHLPVHSVRASTIHIITLDGTPMPMGSLVKRSRGREDIVGYDGVAYLTDIADDNVAEIIDGDQHCLIEFGARADEPVICYPR